MPLDGLVVLFRALMTAKYGQVVSDAARLAANAIAGKRSEPMNGRRRDWTEDPSYQAPDSSRCVSVKQPNLRWWLNRHRCNRDVSMHSVAPTGRHLGDNSLRISEIRLLSSAILKGFGRTGLSKAPLLRNASAYPVMSKVLIPG